MNSEGFGSTFDNLVRTVVWLLQSLAYCILSDENVDAVRKIATHERCLSYVMIHWSRLQLRHCSLQPSYVSNLIHGVAAADVEQFGRKAQGSAVYQFCCTAMNSWVLCVRPITPLVVNLFIFQG